MRKDKKPDEYRLRPPEWAVRADRATETFFGMVGQCLGMMLICTLFIAFCVLLMNSNTFRIIVGFFMMLFALLGPALAVLRHEADKRERFRINMLIKQRDNLRYKANNRTQP